MIPFEIRDFESDKKHFKNIIEIYGLNTIKNLGYYCLIFVFLISFLVNENQIDFDLTVVLFTIITSASILSMCITRISFASSFFFLYKLSSAADL